MIQLERIILGDIILQLEEANVLHDMIIRMIRRAHKPNVCVQ